MLERKMRGRAGLVAFLVVGLVVSAGMAYAAIPDGDGVIHACWDEGGELRVLDPDGGVSCSPGVRFYSKEGVDAAFLAKTEKAADSDLLDGLDSFRYAKGADARVVADFGGAGDDQTALFGHRAEGAYPGMHFRLECDTAGGTTLVASSDAAFFSWWDGAYGEAALVDSAYEQAFPIGNGGERHSFWSGFTNGVYITTLELNTSVRGSSCLFGSTLLKSGKDSPGP